MTSTKCLYYYLTEMLRADETDRVKERDSGRTLFKYVSTNYIYNNNNKTHTHFKINVQLIKKEMFNFI